MLEGYETRLNVGRVSPRDFGNQYGRSVFSCLSSSRTGNPVKARYESNESGTWFTREPNLGDNIFSESSPLPPFFSF